jgi:aerobic-type carbon monoxide dehydrogenase small subunit (CoxS/CutS family)
MLAEGFLAERPEAIKEEIREVVASNLCRCSRVAEGNLTPRLSQNGA